MHPPIIKLLAGNARDFYTFSYADSLSRASVNLILAYSAATVLWCLVEKPFATMTSWLVPSKKAAGAQVKPASTTASTTAKADPLATSRSSFYSIPSSLQSIQATEAAKKALLSQPQGDNNC